MKPLTERAERTRIKYPVAIPTLDGAGVQYKVEIEIEALRDPTTGEIFLDGAARGKIEKVKARYMGLMLPEDIAELREQLGVTQKRMAQLLQIGEKSYCRWETGSERPSRSINLLLAALTDGRIDVAYLESRLKPNFNWRQQIERSVMKKDRVIPIQFRSPMPMEVYNEAVIA
jgi:DNA-binding transcriptional regulator YiaG